MGRRNGRRSGRQNKSNKVDNRGAPLDMNNELFEWYHKAQKVCPEGEFEEMMAAFRRPLPTTFRIIAGPSFAKTMDTLKDKDGACVFPPVHNEETDTMVDPPSPIGYFPGEQVWELKGSKKMIRKTPVMKKMHKWLVAQTDLGTVARQEIVSMAPPFFLDILPGQKVLDMCAAPGSKTCQLIEAVAYGAETPSCAAGGTHKVSGNNHGVRAEGAALDAPLTHVGNPNHSQGMVVANDSNFRRAYTLTHNVKRLQFPGMMICNHYGQHIPAFMKVVEGDVFGAEYTVPTAAEKADWIPRKDYLAARRSLYDRVLCDVPCSGSGTLRKNFDIWGKFNPSSGAFLHSLQLQIVSRGCELMAPGGRLVYSTCALDPIEDEAVISALLASDDSLELVDVSDTLPDFKRQPGISHWGVHVGGEEKKLAFSPSELPEGVEKPKTMFAPTAEVAAAQNLERCMRFLPHSSDTGGFFVAVIRRKEASTPASVASKPATSEQIEAAAADKGLEMKDGRPVWRWGGSKNEEQDPIYVGPPSQQVVSCLQEQYGLSDTFPWHLLCRRSHPSTGLPTSLFMISQDLYDIMKLDPLYGQRFLMVNIGVKAFTTLKRGKKERDHLSTMGATSAVFRLTFEGVPVIAPHMTKRCATVSIADYRRILATSAVTPVLFDKFTTPGFTEFLESQVPGPMVLAPETKGTKYENVSHATIMCWRGVETLAIAVTKTLVPWYRQAFDVKDEDVVDVKPKAADAAPAVTATAKRAEDGEGNAVPVIESTEVTTA